MAAILAVGSPLGVAFTLEAEMSAADRGLAIAREAERRDEGWGDWSAAAEMVLRNRAGQTSRREMRFSALEQAAAGDKRLIVFDHPRDIKGTAFLVHSKKQGDDDRWLYLPALKRVKRIASANQSGPFVGSEFAYEDLASQEVEKYTYRHLRDEAVDSVDAFVIERVPRDPDSGYEKQILWLDKAELRPLKTEYYDRKGTLLKTLTIEGYARHADAYWRAARFVMENHVTGKSTELLWRDYEFGLGLNERDFDHSSLKRMR